MTQPDTCSDELVDTLNAGASTLRFAPGETPASLTAKQTSRKSWWLYAVVLTPWLASLVAFNPYLWSLVARPQQPAGPVLAAIYVGLTNVFWLYGLYHLVNALMGAWLARREPRPTTKAPGAARVAVLYTTMNDFQPRALEHCLRQDHPGCHVYVLDDSTKEEARLKVDAFVAGRAGVTVVRRADRRGFKAGNMNQALRGAAADCDYFAVVDADDCVPPDFVSSLLRRFDDDVGFVQARFTQDPLQNQGLPRQLGPGVDVHWRYYVPCRERYGFMLFYGHGALLRRDAWERVGGFPEIVSEDLAFTARVRAAGLRGVYEPSVVCTEEYPATYGQFLRRQRKWLRGTLQWMLHELPGLLLDRRVPLLERLDVAVTTGSVLLPLPFVAFTLLTLTLPLLTGRWQRLTVELPLWNTSWEVGPFAVVPGDALPTPPALLLAITIMTIFAPVTGYLVLLFRRPWRLLEVIAVGTAVHLSAVVSLVTGAMGYLLTGRIDFQATGDTASARGGEERQVARLTTATGLLVAAGAVLTLNPFPLALAAALLLSGRMTSGLGIGRVLSWLPFLLVIAGVLASTATAFAAGAPLHFLVGAHF